MKQDLNQRNKLSTFFCLYLAQAVPMSFFTTALQVTMREQRFSLSAIALLQLVKLPWILKMLWSPLVDRACTTMRGYKRLIVGSELVYALLVFLAGTLNLQLNVATVILLVLLSLVASATQDIATDALAIRSTKGRERGLMNSMQSMGSFAGSLVGSGLLLVVLHRYGWNSVTQCLSLFVLVAALPLLFNKKISLQQDEDKRQRARLTDFVWFFGQRGVWRQILFLALYYMGIIGIMSNMKPYMVDLGYSMKDIGLINGVVGVASAFAVGYPTGMLVRRYGYTRVRPAVACAMLGATLLFTILSVSVPTTLWHGNSGGLHLGHEPCAPRKRGNRLYRANRINPPDGHRGRYGQRCRGRCGRIYRHVWPANRHSTGLAGIRELGIKNRNDA